jgi:hypothetical protein
MKKIAALVGFVTIIATACGGDSGSYEQTFLETDETHRWEIFINYDETLLELEAYGLKLCDSWAKGDCAGVISEEPVIGSKTKYYSTSNSWGEVDALAVAWNGVQTIEIDMSQVQTTYCQVWLDVMDDNPDTRDEWYSIDAGDFPKQFELSSNEYAVISTDSCDYGTVRTFG